MPDIVIAEFMDETAIHDLVQRHDTLYQPDLVDRPEELLAALADARALIVRNRTQVREALLNSAPKLKIIGRLGVGLDNIDLEACKARGIRVFPATGANDDGVAEYVIATILVLLRGAFHAKQEMLDGQWPRTRLMGREIAGKTLGLIGFGAIARKTAARAQALGMAISAYDPFLPAEHPAWAEAQRHETLAAMLPGCDAVSLHVPLGDDTRNMLDAAMLGLMKPDAIVINAARGGVLDEVALVNALKAGKLGGAALDVFAREPLTAEAAAAFMGAPNLILTPHIAGVSVESNIRVSAVTAANVLKALEELS